MLQTKVFQLQYVNYLSDLQHNCQSAKSMVITMADGYSPSSQESYRILMVFVVLCIDAMVIANGYYHGYWFMVITMATVHFYTNHVGGV